MARIAGLLFVLLIAGCTTMKEQKVMDMAEARPKDAVTQITGQCHCGNIKYKAQGPIVKCSYCDCGGCQRATGTLKAPFVTIKRQGFVLTAGEPASFRAESGVGCDCHGVWNFCPKCGTQVFWKGHKGDELDIFAGTLDDTTVFRLNQCSLPQQLGQPAALRRAGYLSVGRWKRDRSDPDGCVPKLRNGAMTELRDTVAYCGLICGVCPGAGQCDCRTAPKPEEAGCYQRNCCISKGIGGCWECEEFPCDNGYFGRQHKGWRGLCVASVQYTREHGLDALVDLVVRKHGSRMDHSPYIHKTPEEVLRILRDVGDQRDSG